VNHKLPSGPGAIANGAGPACIDPPEIAGGGDGAIAFGAGGRGAGFGFGGIPRLSADGKGGGFCVPQPIIANARIAAASAIPPGQNLIKIAADRGAIVRFVSLIQASQNCMKAVAL
jgi:hypothetical protein